LFLRRLMSIVGLLVAVVIALGAPLGFGLISYSNEASALSFQARLNAGHLAKYIRQNGSTWPSHKAQVGEIIELNSTASDAHTRVFAADGALVYQGDGQIPGPTITRPNLWW
jgi:hypothetical protein